MRVLAILAAAVPAATIIITSVALPPDRILPSAAIPLIAIAVALPSAFRSRVRWPLLALGVALAALAASGVQRGVHALGGTSLFATTDPWQSLDLTEGPLPEPPPPWVSVFGFLHPASALDEYDVPPGEHPDQSQPPHAVLVPFLPQRDPHQQSTDRTILIARLTPDPPPTAGPTILRGRLRPLPPHLLGTLVDVQASGTDHAARGLLLDTLEQPQPTTARLAFLAALIALMLSSACHLLAIRPRRDRGA